jgi:hypothetical protein
MGTDLYARSRAGARKRSLLPAVLMAAAALTIGGGASAEGAGGRVFYDGFETGNTNQWVQDSSRTKCTAVRTSVDGKPTHAGSYMLECNWNGVVAWNDPSSYTTVKLNSFSYTREFLLRFRVRFAADNDRTIGSKLFRLYGADSFYISGQLEQPGGSAFIFWEKINGQTGAPPDYGSLPFANGNWHEIEVYVKQNTPGSSDGILRVWQDGSLQQESVNVVSATTGSRWYPVYLMSNWSSNPGWEHDASNHVYWDDFEIFTDTGSGASGSMADATMSAGAAPAPPSAPQNLRIVG